MTTQAQTQSELEAPATQTGGHGVPAGLAAQVALLRRSALPIVAFALGCGVLTLLLAFTVPDTFRARAVIQPASDDSKNPSAALGALGASFGIQLGGPSRIEDVDALLHSQDLTAAVFQKNDLWAEVFGSSYDPRKRGLKRLLPIGETKPLGDWDAIRVAETALKTSVNKKAGTLSVTWESLTPEGCAKVLDAYLTEARARLQTESLDRARKNKAFLQKQLLENSDALARDRLFTLLGQELEKEMLALNPGQAGFRDLDRPRVPDRKAGPQRSILAVAATLLAGLAAAWFTLQRRQREASQARPGGGAGAVQ